MANLKISIIAQTKDIYVLNQLSKRAFNLFQEADVNVRKIGKTMIADYEFQSHYKELIEYVLDELNNKFTKQNIDGEIIDGSAILTNQETISLIKIHKDKWQID